jgi:hypothetical protein
MKLTSRTGADAHFSFTRKTTEIAAEAASDGIYVVRISLPAETLDDATTVRSYKSLRKSAVCRWLKAVGRVTNLHSVTARDTMEAAPFQ